MNAFLSGALGALGVLVTLALVGWLFRRVAGRRFRRRGPFGVARFLRRIGARPDQERAVLAETDALVEAMRALGTDARALRTDLADLLTAPTLDTARVGETVDGRLGRIAEVRSRFVEAVARIHAVLDASQRAQLAEMVRYGHRGSCGRFRGAHA